MELRHLRYFRAVATLLNFSRAAEQLHVGQPTLSRQVKALEAEIGVQLLARNRAHVKLTDAGRLFLAQVEKLLVQIDLAVETARETPTGMEGTLVICTEWMLQIDLFPRVIAEFRQKFPRVEIELREEPIHKHVKLVRSGKAHLGFVPKTAIKPTDKLEYLTLATAETLVAISARHPLAKRSKIHVAELKDEIWLSDADQARDPAYHTFLTHICRRAGFVPQYGPTARTVEGFLGMVGAGLGVAILPSIVLRRAIPAGVRTISSDCDSVEAGAIWDPANDSVLLRNFVAILRGHASATSA